jgi:DMSO/TMAO reductase YedYZ molybdopterin-dependent catalytic subunit
VRESEEADREIRSRTRRSLLTGAAAALAGGAGWNWLRTRRDDDGVRWPLRLALRANEQASRDFFRETRLARTFRASAAEPGRPNGEIGLEEPAGNDWSLRVESSGEDDRVLSLAEIRALPQVEMTTELKCIEGWSRILHWRGARFRDFVERYAPAARAQEYVGMATPDGEYYIGLDMASALHPQTLLCHEMNGKPLEEQHGAPLRLVIPVKYGIKNLKRIGRIWFAQTRPADYWAERGYDWYAGF